jgi:hypothetical protein
MRPLDASTGRSRGWIALRRRDRGVSLGFTLTCKTDDLRGFAHRVFDIVDKLGPMAIVEDFATALAPLAANIVVRESHSAAHLAAIDAARAAIRRLAVFSRVEQVVGSAHAEGVTLLLIAIADRLAPARRDELAAVTAEADNDAALATELATLRMQLSALWSFTSASRPEDSAAIADPA